MTGKPKLQSLILEITQRCNHACLHCYNVWYANKAYPFGELGTERTIALLAKALDEVSCGHVTLTGGEPLLRKDLPVIMDYLHQRHVRTTIISNGHLLDRSRSMELVTHGTGLFELPLLSHRREIHDELSGGKGAWDAVLAALTHIRLAGGQVICAFVATRKNVDDLYETIKLAFAFGAKGLMLNRFNAGGRGKAQLQELMPTFSQVLRALEVANAASKEFSFPISCSIPIQPCIIDAANFPQLSFGFCSAGTERAYYTLDPLGNVRPCNHTDIILGNLFENTFPELIASTRMAEFKCAVPNFCLPCPRRSDCQGGCKAAAQICYGSLAAEEPFLQLNHPATVFSKD